MHATGRPRLMVPITGSFSIRYLVRTGMMEALKDFAIPVICICWDEPELIQSLRVNGYEVHIIPESTYGARYSAIRKRVDFWYCHMFQKSNSINIERRYAARYQPLYKSLLFHARLWYYRLLSDYPGWLNRLFKLEKELLLSDTNLDQMVSLVDRLNVQAVFTVTPFHRQEDLLLRAAKQLGKQMLTAILSFDNITKRGWIPVDYDVYMVWNQDNKVQLLQSYPSAAGKPIYITGAPQFDFYFRPSYIPGKAAWKKEIGIADGFDGKIILYAGGPGNLFPDEPQFLKDIIDAVENGDIAGKVLVLFRCHPTDQIARWEPVIGGSPFVVQDISWTGKQKVMYANITDVDIRKLCATLCHTDVHVNLCSTMTLDGAVFGKPQIGPAYNVFHKHKKDKCLYSLYLQDHFKPILIEEGVQLATSRSEMVEMINNALKNPHHFTGRYAAVLQHLITYTDGNATGRVLEAIRESLEIAGS